MESLSTKSPIFDRPSTSNRNSISMEPNDFAIANNDPPLSFKNKVAMERAREEYHMVAQ